MILLVGNPGLGGTDELAIEPIKERLTKSKKEKKKSTNQLYQMGGI